MISYSYSIGEFLDSIAGKNVRKALALAQQEVYDAERNTTGGRRGAPAARADGCDRYASNIKGFIFFLSNEVKPAVISDELFAAFIEAAETLTDIDKKRLQKHSET